MASWAEQTKENVQPHVDEPIIAVGVLQPAGIWGSIGVGQFSRIAGTIMRKAANKKSGGLGKQGEIKTQMALVAVTEGKLYAFNAKSWGRQWQVAEPIGAWDRSDLDITTTKATLSTKVVVDVKSTGDHYELEATTVLQMKGHNDAFLAALENFSSSSGTASE
ncbi:MAG: hypothetical protein WD271_02700 [Acidimicrobiia bacterium]